MIRLAAALLLAGSAAWAQPPEPVGFRGPPYDGEVPAALTGARIIDAAEAVALHDAGTTFIDVYPRQTRPQGLPPGTLWRAPPHLTISGAIWLYDTGYERLNPAETARLHDGLARATGGDTARPVVIFCRADCWMGWNAAKRAVALGYDHILWFPGGTDDWLLQGRDLVPAEIDPRISPESSVDAR